MAARRIGLVQYRNFGPFEDAEVNFSLPGLTGIEGVIVGRIGADGNGAGKSYLLDGPAWCLWGRCLREDYTGDAIVRLSSTDGAFVKTTIVGGESTIRVERYRQHPRFKNSVYLFIDDQDMTRGTDAETQALINHLLMDFTSAQSSIFFGAREDVRSFFSAPDAQRKRVLDQILGLSQYAEAEKVARRRLAKVATSLAPLRERCARLEGALATQHGLLAALPESQDVAHLHFHVRHAEARVRALERAVAAHEIDVEEAQAELAFEQEQAQAEMAEYCAAVDEYARLKAEVDRDVRKAYGALRSSATLCTRAAQLLEAHAAAYGKTCQTCGQALPLHRHAVILESLQADLTKADATLTAARAAYEAAQTAQRNLVEPVQPRFPHVELAVEFLRAEERALDRLDQRAELARERRSSAEALHAAATSHVAQVRAQIEQDVVALEACTSEVESLQNLADRLTFWVDGFGNQGLRSFLIESEIGGINHRASGYAQKLLGPGAIVRLSATTQLKSKDLQREKLSVDAEIPGCTMTYAGASKGQKRRLDLALLLAFRDIVAERSVGAFRQFFADELFDGLDRTGTEKVVELLREVADRDCPVVLVTHNLQLKSAVDRTVTVRHDADFRATVSTSSS